MEIFYETTIPTPKAFKDINISITSESILLRKKAIPLKDVTGYTYGNTLLKMGPVKGGTLFSVKIFCGKGKPHFFELNRNITKNSDAIVNGIIQGLWKAIGSKKASNFIEGIKKGYEVEVDSKDEIKISPTGILCKRTVFFSSKMVLIEWKELKSNIVQGSLGIGYLNKKAHSYYYPLKDTENSVILLEFLNWRKNNHEQVQDFSKLT